MKLRKNLVARFDCEQWQLTQEGRCITFLVFQVDLVNRRSFIAAKVHAHRRVLRQSLANQRNQACS